MIFKVFQEVNAERAKLWHHSGVRQWGLVDWTNATAGEAGELCNAAKKLQRLHDGIDGNKGETQAELEQAVAEEMADTITYAFLVGSHLGVDVGEELIKKFNAVSERNGFYIGLEEEEDDDDG